MQVFLCLRGERHYENEMWLLACKYMVKTETKECTFVVCFLVLFF